MSPCYYLPDEKLLKPLADVGRISGGFFPAVVRSAPTADDLDRHKADDSRLFLDPFKLLAPA